MLLSMPNMIELTWRSDKMYVCDFPEMLIGGGALRSRKYHIVASDFILSDEV